MQMILRSIAIALVFAVVGCVLVGPRVDVVIGNDDAPTGGYERYLKTERAIEEAGFQRVFLIDSQGSQTRLRADTDGRTTSSFIRSRGNAKQTGVNLVFDKRSSIVRLELWELPPLTTLSDDARKDMQSLLNALRSALGSSSVSVTKNLEGLGEN